MSRDHVASLRLSTDERDQLQRLADRLGETLSVFIRRAALGLVAPPTLPTVVPVTTVSGKVNVIWGEVPTNVTCYP